MKRPRKKASLPCPWCGSPMNEQPAVDGVSLEDCRAEECGFAIYKWHDEYPGLWLPKHIDDTLEMVDVEDGWLVAGPKRRA